MTVVLIVIAYIVITAVELPQYIQEKRKREAVFYTFFMILALAESIAIATAENRPSVASIIKKILSPLLNLKI